MLVDEYQLGPAGWKRSDEDVARAGVTVDHTSLGGVRTEELYHGGHDVGHEQAQAQVQAALSFPEARARQRAPASYGTCGDSHAALGKWQLYPWGRSAWRERPRRLSRSRRSRARPLLHDPTGSHRRTPSIHSARTRVLESSGYAVGRRRHGEGRGRVLGVRRGET